MEISAYRPTPRYWNYRYQLKEFISIGLYRRLSEQENSEERCIFQSPILCMKNIHLWPCTMDGQSKTFGCSRGVLELNFSNPEFRTRSMKLEAFWQNNMTKYSTNLFSDTCITTHGYYSATKSSNLNVPFSTQF